MKPRPRIPRNAIILAFVALASGFGQDLISPILPGYLLLLGLSRADMRQTDAGTYMPARVILYHKNLQRDCGNEAELEAAIRTTIRHELAHHFGFSDEELKEKWPEGA